MKKFLLALIFVAGTIFCADARVNDGESINYRVMFKWGLINKQAGRVNLSTQRASASAINAKLVARSEKWADTFYAVRDTLMGRMNISTMEPSYYEKITHEGGEFKHDIIKYTRKGKNVSAQCQRWKQKSKKDSITKSERILEAEGLTLDMLSSFYYMRAIDYDNMKPGDKKVMTVFSGSRKETLSITFQGIDEVKIDKNAYPAFKITFTFTGEGGKKTSDDMEAWISTKPHRIPIKLEGKLPVGKVQCFYVPSEQ